LSFCSAEALSKQLLLVVVGHCLDCRIYLLLCSEVLLKACNALTHLVGSADWEKVALVVLAVPDAEIVVTALRLRATVAHVTVRLVLDPFKLSLQDPLASH